MGPVWAIQIGVIRFFFEAFYIFAFGLFFFHFILGSAGNVDKDSNQSFSNPNQTKRFNKYGHQQQQPQSNPQSCNYFFF